jgi:hypothetical protein
VGVGALKPTTIFSAPIASEKSTSPLWSQSAAISYEIKAIG